MASYTLPGSRCDARFKLRVRAAENLLPRSPTRSTVTLRSFEVLQNLSSSTLRSLSAAAASLLLAAIHALPPETKENFVLTASNPSLLTLLAHNHVRFELDTHGHARWVLAPP
jgi:hypothetical protein